MEKRRKCDIIIGLDPSSKKIAVSITDGDNMDMRTRLLKGTDIADVALQAFRYVRSTVKEFVLAGHTVYLFIEAPVLGRGGAHATIKQAQIGGAMYAGGQSGGAEVHLINNQTWKKAVVGKGNIGKPEIKKWVAKAWPAAHEMTNGDQDLIDAACIMKYGIDRVAAMKRIEERRQDDELVVERNTKRAATRRNHA